MFVRKLDATKLVTSGDTVRMECKVTGSPVILFKWFKDEMEISSGPKFTMTVTDLVATLEISHSAVGDSGDYVCVASSEAGSDRCSSTVTVKGWFSLGLEAHFLSVFIVTCDFTVNSCVPGLCSSVCITPTYPLFSFRTTGVCA